MKKILVIHACLSLVCYATRAQGGLWLDDNVHLVGKGSIHIVIDNGKWKNTESKFARGTSIVKFTGDASTDNTLIEGDETTFYDLEIAKSQNDLRIHSNTVEVYRNLKFTSRNLDVNGNTISLIGSGTVVGENGSTRSYSSSSSSSMKGAKILSSPSSVNLRGLGILFTTSANLGNTTVDRRYVAQTLPTGNGIQRYWRVTTGISPAAQNATLRFHYFDEELNGINEAALTIWRSTNNGASWTNMGFSSRSFGSNYIQQIALNDVSGWWTLGAVPPAPLTGAGDERTVENNVFPESDWSVFPNPFTDWVTVAISSQTKETVVLECCNAEGKVVLSTPKQLEIGENTFQFDLEPLSPGFYFIRVLGGTFKPISMLKK